jgi:hypothetical protein
VNQKVTIRDVSWHGKAPMRIRGRITGVEWLKGKGYHYHFKPLKADVNLLHMTDREEYLEMYKYPSRIYNPQSVFVAGWNKRTGYI